MDRRQIISMIGGAIAAASTGRSASLGAAAKIPRIGIIDNEPDWDAFRQELHDLNYTEGHTVEFEYRRADGMTERLAAAARELAQLPVDVIAVYGTPAAQAAQQASKSIPIVVIGVSDGVGPGDGVDFLLQIAVGDGGGFFASSFNPSFGRFFCFLETFA